MIAKKLGFWESNELLDRCSPLLYTAWKHAYDKAVGLGEPAEIWIDEDSSDFLIVKEQNTPDEGVIPILVLDTILPASFTDLLLQDTKEPFIRECGFDIVYNSRRDYIIDLKRFNDFNSYIGDIGSQIKRCWNICEKRCIRSKVSFDVGYRELANYKKSYWESKGEDIDYLDIDYTAWYSLESLSINNIGYMDSVPVFFSWMFNSIEGNFYWINTFRNTDSKYAKYGFGNYALLKNIKEAFDKGAEIFNMGIDIFPYKRNWLGRSVPVKGIRRI